MIDRGMRFWKIVIREFIIGKTLNNILRRKIDVTLKDSGNRSTYLSGAQRDNAEGKGRFDLIPFQPMMRLARHYEAGARKYSDRNWERGMNVSRYVDAAMRHLTKYLDGWNDEDHLSAVAWNVFAIMHHEKEFPDLQDLPAWQNKTSNWIVEEPLE